VRPAVFLDRDGTLIEGEGYLGDPAGVHAIPGAREAVRLMSERGYLCIVVTNQSGVARGFFSEDEYTVVAEATDAAVGPLDAQYACFHLPEGRVAPWNSPCGCRKPLPGLLTGAAREWDVDLSRSVLVGDALRDLQAAVAAGVEPVLVRTGKGARNEPLLRDAGLADARVVDSLLDVARALPDVAAEPQS